MLSHDHAGLGESKKGKPANTKPMQGIDKV